MSLNVGVISTYRPMRCGLATFASDLVDHLIAPRQNASIAVISGAHGNLPYPAEVGFVVCRNKLGAYTSAAEYFEFAGTHVISLQHEYGIFGGPSGSYILHFLRSVTLPVVTTLHTVLENPTTVQRQILSEICRLSSRVVVFTPSARSILQSQIGVEACKLAIVPHGVPDLPFAASPERKATLGLEGKLVLMTMGLLSPNKGIETAIRALPAVLCRFLETVYVVQGATHPNVKQQCGESYRRDLEELAETLGVRSQVLFLDRYVSADERAAIIAAADVYISPHKDLDQAGSGTLAYAIGAGRAIVSAPYAYAREALSGGTGVLYRAGDPDDLARHIIELLTDDDLRSKYARAAYLASRRMLWSEVASEYATLFETAAISHAGRLNDREMATEDLPPLCLHHVQRLTDETGITQHAVFTVPNRHEGFSTDDNARALMLAVDTEAEFPEISADLASTYLAFLWHAFNRRTNRMRNFLTYDRHWLEEIGSEECHGRTLWSLGHVIANSKDPALHGAASQLFLEAIPATLGFTSLRAISFAILGLVKLLKVEPARVDLVPTAMNLSDRLVKHYSTCSSPEWPWFEDRVTYFNARIPESLLRVGLVTSRNDLIVTVMEYGRRVAKRYVTRGPIAAISTTTKNQLEIDDESRHVSIWLDQSREQTRRIIQAHV